MKEIFYICRHCGNIVEMINDAGVPLMCCGDEMDALIPNTTDAATEKHLPVVTFKDNILCVKIGEVTHPMVDEHFIEWIYVKTENGGHHRRLKPNEAPQAEFCICNDKPVAVYAYCNIHGLWMTEMK